MDDTKSRRIWQVDHNIRMEEEKILNGKFHNTHAVG